MTAHQVGYLIIPFVHHCFSLPLLNEAVRQRKCVNPMLWDCLSSNITTGRLLLKSTLQLVLSVNTSLLISCVPFPSCFYYII